MEIVIDAQVVNYYFVEEVIGKVSTSSGRPAELMARLGRADRAYIDASGNIAAEWEQQCVHEPEWFNAWFGGLLASGAVSEIPTQTCSVLLKKLEVECGFPKSRDRAYVRAARAVAEKHGEAGLISEDLDFYEPSEKKCGEKRRQKILESGAGSVARCLRKAADIHVRSVAGHLAAA